MLFAKTEHKEMSLSFVYDDNSCYYDMGHLCIISPSYVFGADKCLFITFKVSVEDLDYLTNVLKKSSGRLVKLVVEMRGNKVKNVYLDINHFADICGDDRIKNIDIVDCGLKKRK